MSPVSALAAFNNSGTQATAATTSISGDDVMSAFWGVNDTHRFLLFGSSINEIPTTGGAGAQWNGNHIFTVNNDLDALGDLFFTVQMTMPTMTVVAEVGHAGPATAPFFDSKTVTISFEAFGGSVGSPGVIGHWTEFGLAKFIRRIEFMVGTQVWQTMENNDLLNCLNAESYESAYTNVGFGTNGGNTNLGTAKYQRDVGPVYSGASYQASFRLPLLTKTLGPNLNKFVNQTEDGYLMAAAPHQTVKIRVSYSNNVTDLIDMAKQVYLNQAMDNNPPGVAATATSTNSAMARAYTITSGLTPSVVQQKITSISTQLFGKHQVMCNAERQQLRNMAQGLPKRIKMTQHASFTTAITKGQTYTVDLDHFSLFASALVINVADLDSQTVTAYACPDSSQVVSAQVFDSYDQVQTSNPASVFQIGVQASETRPVVVEGTLHSAELILNSSSISGVLPGFFLTSSAADSMGLFSNYYFAGKSSRAPGSGYQVFPLSSHAYDASAVPLNRFDNIRLRLSTNQSSKAGSTSKTSVTCLGETTALYKGGAASLAMY